VKKDRPINLRMNSLVKEELEKNGFSMQKIFDQAINGLITVVGTRIRVIKRKEKEDEK